MKRIIVSITLLLLSAQVLLAQRTYLVSVGIADYPGYENDLNLTVKDALAIANICKINNNAVYIPLLDDDATRDAIKYCMSSLFAEAGRNDIVILFFSGHGCQEVWCLCSSL